MSGQATARESTSQEEERRRPNPWIPAIKMPIMERHKEAEVWVDGLIALFGRGQIDFNDQNFTNKLLLLAKHLDAVGLYPAEWMER